MPVDLLPKLENAIGLGAKARYQAIQALAHRHYLLSGDSQLDQHIHGYSFEGHQRLARRLYRTSAMRNALRSLLQPDRPAVQLLLRQHAFGRCFTPNAMLVSLLARAVTEFGNGGRPPLVLGSQVVTVQPVKFPPVGLNTADDWASVSVRVTLSAAASTGPRSISPEVELLRASGIARVNEGFEDQYRCIFVRIGAGGSGSLILRQVEQAIAKGTGKNAPLREVRHAVPQSPIR